MSLLPKVKDEAVRTFYILREFVNSEKNILIPP